MTRFSLAVSAVVGLTLIGCDDLQRPTYPETVLPGSPAAPSELWFYHAGTDALGLHYGMAVTDGGRAGEVWYLSVLCRRSTFDVGIDDGTYEASTSTEVRYSIDGAPEVTVPWVISSELSLYRGGSPLVFAESLATSRTLGITVSKQLRTGFVERRVVFKLDGLAPHLPALRSQCGV